MSLTTRCPTCGTAFRVQPVQLSARGGKVRCGKCAAVFDGVAALVDASALPSTEPAPALAETEPSPQLALFEAARRGPQGGDAANDNVPEATFLEEELPPSRSRFVWGFFGLLALLALAVQGVLYYRTEIAVLLPEVRPHLQVVCAALRCELRLPRKPKQMAIESSDLQAEGKRENVIVLNAVLRNQAQFAQEFPALELTLTDERDEAVARRVLLPSDYLTGSAAGQITRGLAPGADAALRIYFDTSGLKAVGYRMYLFFP